MSKLPIISGIEAIKAFSKAGWTPHRQVGSHVVISNNPPLKTQPPARVPLCSKPHRASLPLHQELTFVQFKKRSDPTEDHKHYPGEKNFPLKLRKHENT